MKKHVHGAADPLGNACGFTLFEILISLFIFAIVVTTIFGSYQAVFSKTGAIQEGIDVCEMMNNCLGRMTEDLKSAYVDLPPGYAKPKFDSEPDPWRMVGDAYYTGSGSFSRFRFASSAHMSFSDDTRTGIAAIVYYVSRTRDDVYVLRRSDSLPPYPKFPLGFEEKAADPVLCDNVKSLKFIYYDEEGQEHENWDSESQEFKYATPSAIKITIETGDESHSVFFGTTVKFPVFREKTD
ncbi:MAG: type II secretion system protein GspJ [Desulfobacterales bacterium]